MTVTSTIEEWIRNSKPKPYWPDGALKSVTPLVGVTLMEGN